MKSVTLRLLSLAACAGLGILMGWIALVALRRNAVGDIFAALGIWTFAASLMARFAKAPLDAALRVPAFFACMVVAYYVAMVGRFGGVLPRHVLLWSALSLLSPIGALALWNARKPDWIGAACAAPPIGLLMAEGIPFLRAPDVAPGLDLLMAGLLVVVLPVGWRNRLLAGVAGCFIGLLLWRFGFIPWVFSLTHT